MTQTSAGSAIPGQRDSFCRVTRPQPFDATPAGQGRHRLTLCVGRNNTGKTSLAKLFKLFIARDHT
ncbi:hypothetical protein [Streptomyces aureoversilis]|uniref:AAA domain-containing protein n=1 Tax=Streptomyces aureoversilis TaxID=67277 RepID=A0ABV9ZSG8_9ACTN